jgi:hypothetical protein
MMRTYGVNWNEFGRNYRCFRLQRVEVDIFDLLDFPTDEDQMTLLTVLDYCNIIRNMSLHDTRRTNFALSKLLRSVFESRDQSPWQATGNM